MNETHGVGDMGSEAWGVHVKVVVGDLPGVDGEAVEHPGKNPVGVVKSRLELLGEDGPIEQVLDAQAYPHGPIGIGRSDAPPGGTNLVLAQVPLVQSVEFLVVGQDQVSIPADPQAFGRHPPGFKRVHLLNEDPWVDDDSVADDRDHVIVEDAAGDQLQGKGLSVDNQGMPGVVAALVADNHRHLTSHEVGELALALVTPLRPDDDRRGHGNPPDRGPYAVSLSAGQPVHRQDSQYHRREGRGPGGSNFSVTDSGFGISTSPVENPAGAYYHRGTTVE